MLFRQLMVREHMTEFEKWLLFCYAIWNINSNILVRFYYSFGTDLNYSLYSDVFSESERFLLRPNDSLINSLNRSLESQLILLKPNEQTFVNVSLTLDVSFIHTLKFNNLLNQFQKTFIAINFQ